MSPTQSGNFPSFPTVAFLDRDGTIMRDTNYISDPNDVVLLPQAAEAIAMLNSCNIPVVVITNQSGIGRGYYTLLDYERVHNRMIELLAELGAKIDGTFMCPHPPDQPCTCRKPSSGLFVEAIETLDLDMSHPAFIGDRWRDVSQSLTMGGSAFVISPSESSENVVSDSAFIDKYAVKASSLYDAVEQLLTVYGEKS